MIFVRIVFKLRRHASQAAAPVFLLGKFDGGAGPSKMLALRGNAGRGSAPENRMLAALSLAEPLLAGALWEGLTLAGRESKTFERPSASGAVTGAGPREGEPARESLAKPLMVGALWEGLTLAGGESRSSKRPSASGAVPGTEPNKSEPAGESLAAP